MADFTFSHREEGFDNHIEHSIRGYNNLSCDIINMSRYFVEDNTNVVDIGCSTGKTLAAMIEQNGEFAPLANYVGIENADGFADDMKARMEAYPVGLDLRFEDIREYAFSNCSLVTSIFTLQFMPRKDRRAVIQRIYDGLNDGGAFIFAEKTVAENSRMQEMLTFSFYDHKREHFTAEDIMEKEVTLRNMLKPNTYAELVCMIRDAGFTSIQTFWQNHLFIGAIALK